MKRRIIAIDPGTDRSAVVTIDIDGEVHGQILDNYVLEKWLRDFHHKKDWTCVIEMIACYGQRVGREVFETCVWIGKLMSAWQTREIAEPARLVRRDVKMELCATNRANDADIRGALIDLYGPGKLKAVGLKATPGPLYGFKKDMWAALAVAVTFDRMLDRTAIPVSYTHGTLPALSSV